ncbi:MAG: TatD family hydrolase [Candidatus Dependentiae bacterium]
MFVDTHCHINIMVKKTFDTPLTPNDFSLAQEIITSAHTQNVTTIINVGTSLIESNNCIQLAQKFKNNYAVIGIHPNDITSDWQDELKTIDILAKNKNELNIVGIGECGLDFHYPDFNVQKQKDVFKEQIELSLKHNLALVVHTRDARDETLQVIEEYHKEISRGIIHCFSEDLAFAQQVIDWGFALGLGGTITYPKNNHLREVAQSVPLSSIVLETDAPFLPPQSMRGKKNSPVNIPIIAQYLAELRAISIDEVAQQTTDNANRIFGLH